MIKLLKFLKPHRKFAVFTLLLAAVNNILTLAFPLLMSQLINNGITQGNLENIKSVRFKLLLLKQGFNKLCRRAQRNGV